MLLETTTLSIFLTDVPLKWRESSLLGRVLKAEARGDQVWTPCLPKAPFFTRARHTHQLCRDKYMPTLHGWLSGTVLKTIKLIIIMPIAVHLFPTQTGAASGRRQRLTVDDVDCQSVTPPFGTAQQNLLLIFVRGKRRCFTIKDYIILVHYTASVLLRFEPGSRQVLAPTLSTLPSVV